jgi:small ligand-binding sensory domain FIST
VTVRCVVVSSTATDPADAVADIAARLTARQVHLPVRGTATALVLASPTHAVDWPALAAALTDILGQVPWMTITSSRVFHDQRIEEQTPGLVVMLLLGCRGHATVAPQVEMGGPIAAGLLQDGVGAHSSIVGMGAAMTRGFDFLGSFDEARVDVVGGVTDGGVAIRGDDRTGPAVVGSLFLQDVVVIPAFSLAATAISPMRTVTAIDDKLLLTLDGKPAQSVMRSDISRHYPHGAPPSTVAYLRFESSDSPPILREVVGVDPNHGGIAVPMRLRVGARCAFATCLARPADDDLQEMLSTLRSSLGRPPLAVLAFSSTTRGGAFFGSKQWDVTRIMSAFGPDVPVLGIATRREVATMGQTHLTSTSLTVAAILPTTRRSMLPPRAPLGDSG